VVNEMSFTVNHKTRTAINQLRLEIDSVVANEGVEKLIAEGGEGFYNYVNSIGLATDPNLIVLSSMHDYYYDAEELNNVKTIINLKELNKIKQIRSFLKSHLYFLSPKCNFVGLFVNNAKVDRYALKYGSSFLLNIKRSEDIENSIVSRSPFINMLYSIMDAKTNAYMSESNVTSLLKDFGFKVKDMTEHNGLTYFHSQKVGENFN
jgi:uncharacterized protein YlbG (UPF0298 family)